MGGIANVVGIPINVITERELLGLMKLYSSNDYMNVVYLISVSTCQNLVEQEEMKLSLKTADLVLPGEKILLSKTNRHKIRGVVNNYR